jgi:hypothetical protein
MRTVYYLYDDNCYNHSGIVPDDLVVYNGVFVTPPEYGQYQIPRWKPTEAEWEVVPNYYFTNVYNIYTGDLVSKQRGEALNPDETVNWDDVAESVRKLKLIPSVKSEILVYLEWLMEQGTTYLNKIFQSRELDLNRINLAINKVNIGGDFAGFWRDRNNEWVAMTFDQLKELGLVLGDYWQGKFIKSRQLIDDLPNLSYDELANYNVAERFNSSD